MIATGRNVDGGLAGDRFRIATAPGSRAANRCPIRPYPTMP